MLSPTVTEITVSVAKVLVLENAAVTFTLVADAPSDMLVLPDRPTAARFTFGLLSSSVIVTSVPFTVSPVELPSTLMLSLPSTSVSLVGVSANVAVPLVWPAAMVTSKPATAA